MDFLKSEESRNNLELKKIKAELKKLGQQLMKLSSKKGPEVKGQRREFREQMKGLSNDMYHLKGTISYNIIKSADVVVSTQTGSFDDVLERFATNDLHEKNNLGIPS